MFGWLKSKTKKRLSVEADKAIFQCENFISFTFDTIEEGEYDHAFVISTQDQLMDLTLRLFHIKNNCKEDGTFKYKDADDLMKLNKECRRVYSRLKVSKSFDEEFKYITKEKEKNPYSTEMRKGFLSEMSTVKAMERASKRVEKRRQEKLQQAQESQEKKEQDKINPYSSKMKEGLLSEKSLLTHLQKEFKKQDQQKQVKDPQKEEQKKNMVGKKGFK